MVLEKLVSIREAINHPIWMLVIGAVVALISLGISFIVFPQSVGLFTTVLVTFIMTPFMVNLLTYEAYTTEVEIKRKMNMNIFQRHSRIFLIYIAFFTGMMIALSIVFLFLPNATVEKLFQDQISEIKIIRGNFIFGGTFGKIFINNIGVLILSVLFAFIFGSGAVFILAWNASVLSTAIGLTARSLGGVNGIPIAIATYMPHGVFEIAAYFLAGIAGGILSALVMQKKTVMFKMVVKDSMKIIGGAVFLLLVAAMIETALISG